MNARAPGFDGGQTGTAERRLLDLGACHVSNRGTENAEDRASEHHGGVDRGARNEQAKPSDDLKHAHDDAQRLPEAGDVEGLDHDVGAEKLRAAGADIDESESSLDAVEPR